MFLSAFKEIGEHLLLRREYHLRHQHHLRRDHQLRLRHHLQRPCLHLPIFFIFVLIAINFFPPVGVSMVGPSSLVPGVGVPVRGPLGAGGRLGGIRAATGEPEGDITAAHYHAQHTDTIWSDLS